MQMLRRLTDWIWHVRGSLALAPGQSSEDAFDRLSPLFHETGTSYERGNDTLTFRKKDQAAQDTRPDEMLAGTITIVYRGDRGRVRHQLAQTQADYLKEVISSQHVFLEDDQSLEVLLVQGPATLLKELCDALRRVRGVHQLQLVTTTALLPPLYEQEPAPTQPGSA